MIDKALDTTTLNARQMKQIADQVVRENEATLYQQAEKYKRDVRQFIKLVYEDCMNHIFKTARSGNYNYRFTLYSYIHLPDFTSIMKEDLLLTMSTIILNIKHNLEIAGFKVYMFDSSGTNMYLRIYWDHITEISTPDPKYNVYNVYNKINHLF